MITKGMISGGYSGASFVSLCETYLKKIKEKTGAWQKIRQKNEDGSDQANSLDNRYGSGTDVLSKSDLVLLEEYHSASLHCAALYSMILEFYDAMEIKSEVRIAVDNVGTVIVFNGKVSIDL